MLFPLSLWFGKMSRNGIFILLIISGAPLSSLTENSLPVFLQMLPSSCIPSEATNLLILHNCTFSSPHSLLLILLSAFSSFTILATMLRTL